MNYFYPIIPLVQITSEGQPVPRIEPRERTFGFDVLTISGQSGTMKSTTTAILMNILGMPSESRGEDFRGIVHEEVLGFVPRLPQMDFGLDLSTQDHMVQAAQTQHPLIVEARLGSIMLHALQHQQRERGEPVVRGISILLESDEFLEEEQVLRRHRRVHKRQPRRSLAETAQLTQEREDGDRAHWQTIYPTLLDGNDPFDPDLKGQDGEAVYDIRIRVDGLTPEQVAFSIFHHLIERGDLESSHSELLAAYNRREKTKEMRDVLKTIRDAAVANGVPVTIGMNGSTAYRGGIEGSGLDRANDLDPYFIVDAAYLREHGLEKLFQVLGFNEVGLDFRHLPVLPEDTEALLNMDITRLVFLDVPTRYQRVPMDIKIATVEGLHDAIAPDGQHDFVTRYILPTLGSVNDHNLFSPTKDAKTYRGNDVRVNYILRGGREDRFFDKIIPRTNKVTHADIVSSLYETIVVWDTLVSRNAFPSVIDMVWNDIVDHIVLFNNLRNADGQIKDEAFSPDFITRIFIKPERFLPPFIALLSECYYEILQARNAKK